MITSTRHFYRGKKLTVGQVESCKNRHFAVWGRPGYSDRETYNDTGDQWVGTAGEDLFEQWYKQRRLPLKNVAHLALGYDFVAHDKIFIDVKTKMRESHPAVGFECAVPLSQLELFCTHYVFASYHRALNLPVLFGWISKDEFLSSPKTLDRTRGQRLFQRKDRAGADQYYTVKKECKEISIHDLYTLDELKQLIIDAGSTRQLDLFSSVSG